MNTRRSNRNSYISSSNNNTSCMTTAASKTLTPELYAVNAKICRLVAKHPCIYDRTDPHYMKKNWVDSAWVQIAKQMEDNINSCKERWRNIRTSFARSINVKRAPNVNRTKPYYLYEELEFLKHHITPGVPVPTRSRRSSNKARLSYDEEADDDYIEGFEGQSELALMNFNQSPYGERYSLDSNDDMQKLDTEPVADESNNEQSPKLSTALKRQLAKTNSMEVAPLVCPCPPKKRQRANTEISDAPEDPSMPIGTVACLDASNANSTDYDDAFLRGLKPEMSHMTFQQKLHFKCRIYELLVEIFPDKDMTAGSFAVSNGSIEQSAEPSISNYDLPHLSGNESIEQPAEPTISNYAMSHFSGFARRPNTLQLPKLVQKPKAKDASLE